MNDVKTVFPANHCASHHPSTVDRVTRLKSKRVFTARPCEPEHISTSRNNTKVKVSPNMSVWYHTLVRGCIVCSRRASRAHSPMIISTAVPRRDKINTALSRSEEACIVHRKVHRRKRHTSQRESSPSLFDTPRLKKRRWTHRCRPARWLTRDQKALRQ